MHFNTIKFTDEEIERIRKMDAEGVSMEKIAADFEVGYKPIRRIFEEHKIGRFAHEQYLIRHKGADSTFTVGATN